MTLKTYFPSLGISLIWPSVGVGSRATAERPRETNPYSCRQPFLIGHILDGFTKGTEFRGNIVFAKKSLLEKIRALSGTADAVLVEDANQAAAFRRLDEVDFNDFRPSGGENHQGEWADGQALPLLS